MDVPGLLTSGRAAQLWKWKVPKMDESSSRRQCEQWRDATYIVPGAQAWRANFPPIHWANCWLTQASSPVHGEFGVREPNWLLDRTSATLGSSKQKRRRTLAQLLVLRLKEWIRLCEWVAKCLQMQISRKGQCKIQLQTASYGVISKLERKLIEKEGLELDTGSTQKERTKNNLNYRESKQSRKKESWRISSSSPCLYTSWKVRLLTGARGDSEQFRKGNCPSIWTWKFGLTAINMQALCSPWQWIWPNSVEECTSLNRSRNIISRKEVQIQWVFPAARSGNKVKFSERCQMSQLKLFEALNVISDRTTGHLSLNFEIL